MTSAAVSQGEPQDVEWKCAKCGAEYDERGMGECVNGAMKDGRLDACGGTIRLASGAGAAPPHSVKDEA